MQHAKNSHNNAFSVEEQLQDENSLYNHYKTMIHARRSHEALVLGEIKGIRSSTESNIVAFKWVLKDKSLLVLHNLADEEKTAFLEGDEAGYRNVYFSSKDGSQVNEQGGRLRIQLAPYGTLILEQ
jgi:alpha-amylase